MEIKIRKLRLQDVKILQEWFLTKKTLKDTGVNARRDKITLKFVEEWLKERIE